MRAARRWWGRAWGELRIARRRRAVAAELGAALGAARPLRLRATGARGHDSLYLVAEGAKAVGVLRLVNPHKRRPVPAPDMPVVLPEAPARLAREWDAYARGWESGLTPRPLWRTRDALLCTYFEGGSLQRRLLRDPAAAWDLLLRAAAALDRLHALGPTHMDASLANILCDEAMERLVFIDFEYAPGPGLSPAAQRAYDHLRLIESCWKMLPASARLSFQPWLDRFAAGLDGEVRQADLSRLAPGLQRVLAAPGLGDGIRRLFR